MSILTRASAAFRRQMVRRGSTRSAALLRIGMSALVMTRWGQNLTLDQIMAPSWLVAFGLITLSASFFMLIGFMSRISTGITAICGLAIGFGLNSWAGWQSASFSHHEACLAVCVAMVALQGGAAVASQARCPPHPPRPTRRNVTQHLAGQHGRGTF